MIKRLKVIALTLLLLCGIRGAYIIYEVKDWEPYVKTSYIQDSLVYAFRSKDYNYLYKLVVINEVVGEEERNELYDFAHYYNNLCNAHKNYLLGKDYSKYLDNMNLYLNKIETKDILLSVEELNNIYKFD